MVQMQFISIMEQVLSMKSTICSRSVEQAARALLLDVSSVVKFSLCYVSSESVHRP